MVLDTVYLCQCQNGDGPSEVMQMHAIQQVAAGAPTNGNTASAAGEDVTDEGDESDVQRQEVEPIK